MSRIFWWRFKLVSVQGLSQAEAAKRLAIPKGPLAIWVAAAKTSPLPTASGATHAVGAIESGSGNLPDSVVNSALRYRSQAPLIDSLLAEVELKGDNINGLLSGLNGQQEQVADTPESGKLTSAQNTESS